LAFKKNPQINQHDYIDSFITSRFFVKLSKFLLSKLFWFCVLLFVKAFYFFKSNLR